MSGGFNVLDRSYNIERINLSSPGAWMYDGASHCWPILNSGELTSVFYDSNQLYADIRSYIDKADDAWSVLPGFKLELYSGIGYTMIGYVLDNTNGATYLTKRNNEIFRMDIPTTALGINTIRSVKLYYKGTEIEFRR